MTLGFNFEEEPNYSRCINVKLLPMYDDVTIPKYESTDAVGMDLHAYIDSNSSGDGEKAGIHIPPHHTVMIGTGLKIGLPVGIGGFIFARSGLSSKKGLSPANKVGIIDPDYRGEIKVALHNHSDCTVTVKHDDRIAQLVFMPYFIANLEKVDKLSETERNEGGFGHSGK